MAYTTQINIDLTKNNLYFGKDINLAELGTNKILQKLGILC